MTDKALAENDLEKLAARVESATGPDRELDVAILRATDPTAPSDARPLPWERCFTSSLDAAMTLVPEGWGFKLIRSSVESRGARVSMWHQERGPKPSSDAVTVALALTAAALRAMAHSGER